MRLETSIQLRYYSFCCESSIFLFIGITEFHKTADEFITMIENLSKHVEQEKIKALGTSNLLKSMAKQREAQQKQYQVIDLRFSLS